MESLPCENEILSRDGMNAEKCFDEAGVFVKIASAGIDMMRVMIARRCRFRSSVVQSGGYADEYFRAGGTGRACSPDYGWSNRSGIRDCTRVCRAGSQSGADQPETGKSR